MTVNSNADIFAGNIGINASTVSFDGDCRSGVIVINNNGIGIKNLVTGTGTATTKIVGAGDFVQTLGSNGTGILTGSTAGAVNVTVGANAFVQENFGNGRAIQVTNGTNVTITNAGLIEGGGNGADPGAIFVQNATVGTTITNAATGSINTTAFRVDDLVIGVSGAPAAITNNGFIRGRVNLTANADQFINNNLWEVNGVSNFGGGNDFVTNNNLS